MRDYNIVSISMRQNLGTQGFRNGNVLDYWSNEDFSRIGKLLGWNCFRAVSSYTVIVFIC